MIEKSEAENVQSTSSNDALLSLRQMEVFHTVMQTRSITGASKVLDVSQPVLSRIIKRIEEQLGISLFDRDRNGLVPTHEARQIFNELDPLIQQLHGVNKQIARIARGETAVFRVGSTASVARALIPQALKSLSSEVPDIKLFFDFLPVNQIEEYLLTSQGEAVITLASTLNPLLAVEHVGKIDLVAVLNKEHPLANRSIIHANDLQNCDFIAFSTDGAHQIIVEKYFNQEKITVNTRAVARYADAGMALASEGIGIILVDYLSTLGPLSDNLVVKPIQNAPQFTVSVLSNKRKTHSAHLKQLTEILTNKLVSLQTLA